MLDAKNRVVGIAVRGYEMPDRFTEKDEMSSFVPISMIGYMREPEKAGGAGVVEGTPVSERQEPPAET